ncbi:hypothetical protein JCM19240_2218 [Vibrio maritimus]|uniref:Uncharacterized protein n=1 Tax=Vibrio maritimus TaxID=990268 RepID=A0A090TQZ0_9VIBR|nr:hypothetical protein JCM19240_2218 [Vibrio maritimus]
MKKFTLALPLLALSSLYSYANDAILNVEGSIQINGRTVINSDGQWAAYTTEIEVDCSENKSALRDKFDQGYSNLRISAGDCYAPRWYEELSVTFIGATDAAEGLVSISRMPEDPYDYDGDILDASSLLDVGIGAFLYIRGVNIVDNTLSETGYSTVNGELNSTIYLRDVSVTTNQAECIFGEGNSLYLRDSTLSGCSSTAIRAENNANIKMKRSTISDGEIALGLISTLAGSDNTISNVDLHLSENSYAVFENEITSIGSVVCYDNSVARSWSGEGVNYCQ